MGVDEVSLKEAAAIAQRQAEAVLTERGGDLVGDEFAVFGQCTWTPHVKPAQACCVAPSVAVIVGSLSASLFTVC